MTSVLLLALLCAAPAPLKSDLERTVRDRFEAVGRTAPPIDAALSAAADELARRALSHGIEDAASLLRVTSALSRQRAWEPSPVLVGLRAPTQKILEDLKKQDLGAEPTTHVGVGLAVDRDVSTVVILLARRRIELSPFPRSHARPVSNQRLCGVLSDDLNTAELFVTRPAGAVERAPMTLSGTARCGSIDFSTTGRHAVEVLASGPRGPEVAALFFVDVGALQAQEGEGDAIAEPKDAASARAMLLLRINALRLQMGLSPLQFDAALDVVAQAWAQRLADEGFFSHVAPDGTVLTQRLNDAGYAYASAGENLGLSSGPLAAHFGIEHSPGHRDNLLGPHYRKLGLGLATRPDGLQVLVEVLAQVEDKDPLATVYASIAAERKRKKLPALVTSTVLEGLAQAHVREALEKDTPKADLPGRPRLSERAFELLEDLNGVSVDVAVAETPRLGGESKNLAAPGNRMVGVGLVKGDSPRFGRGRYWIVVIYGAPRD